MSQIRCPHCGGVFQVDESGYADIARQVRDQEFQHDLAERERILRDDHKKDLELALADAEAASREALGQKDAQIAELRHKLDSQMERFDTEKTLAVTQATIQVAKERDDAMAQVRLVESESERALGEMRIQMAEQLRSKDDIIAYKDSEISQLRDMKAKLPTKMLGESLEQHCEIAFNRIRATAFPNAYFEKDNEIADGTKGDYIFREVDENGIEIISIMFEMKNEQDGPKRAHRNEDFFKKLDSDRTKKQCEYAVLVSLLEPESELYNDGIVDVSYRYEKMYVIRPQFFIPLITVLRNAALRSLAMRTELAQMQRQNIDVTHFEERMEEFKTRFGKNYQLASNRFNTAIEEIDKTISHLQKVKENLLSSEHQLRLANDKAQGLTIRKLTYRNPTMKAKFEDARQAAQDGEEG
ncbi:MAG: DUF2130 domain-containing protein [Actinomycetota bacterium]|nr:DUF2130 domain-containing protein [Actinomycetota bacterium]